MLHLALISQDGPETRKAETLFPTLYDDIATCVRKGHFDAANRLLREHYHVTYEQPSATCYHIGDLGNRDRHAQYVGASNLAHKLGLLSVMEYDEENYLTLNVYGEKGDIEEFKRRLSHECYVQRLAYRLTKAPKDEWSDPRQEYIVGYFNGMAANEPNTPDITDMGSVGMYDGYMDINDPENRDYGR